MEGSRLVNRTPDNKGNGDVVEKCTILVASASAWYIEGAGCLGGGASLSVQRYIIDSAREEQFERKCYKAFDAACSG
jgi:hypothetical protein